MIIIPARLASTRFPQKIFADINGLPMVVATARQAAKVDETVVACDDEKTLELCESHGIKAVMTRVDHASGTDRIYEAAQKLGLKKSDTIVNVQGDEPFIEPEVIEALIKRVKSLPEGFKMASCHKSISKNDAQDPNLVKVVLDANGYALYFSRSVVPHDRDGGFDGYFGHLGLYGFDMASLELFCSLPHAPLEHIEKLEQLRALYHGHKIAMTPVETQSFGIDTPHDLQRALEYFRKEQ